MTVLTEEQNGPTYFKLCRVPGREWAGGRVVGGQRAAKAEAGRPVWRLL